MPRARLTGTHARPVHCIDDKNTSSPQVVNEVYKAVDSQLLAGIEEQMDKTMRADAGVTGSGDDEASEAEKAILAQVSELRASPVPGVILGEMTNDEICGMKQMEQL